MKKYLCLLLFSWFWGMASYAQTSQKISYTYDALNRLTEVAYANGTKIMYNYDVLGNRISTVLTQSCGVLLQTVKSGQWDDVTVWDCGVLPTVVKDVRINSPHLITLPANYTATAKSVELQGSIQYSTNAKVQLGQQ